MKRKTLKKVPARKSLERYEGMIVLLKDYAEDIDLDENEGLFHVLEQAMCQEFERVTGEELIVDENYLLVQDTSQNSRYNKALKNLAAKLVSWLEDSYVDEEFYSFKEYTQTRK